MILVTLVMARWVHPIIVQCQWVATDECRAVIAPGAYARASERRS